LKSDCTIEEIAMLASILILVSGLALGADAPIKPLEVKPFKGVASYSKQVSEILEAKCVGCHSSALAENKLNLEDLAAMLKGGKRGPAIVAGKADESWLFKMAAHRVEPVMPPKNKKDLKPLTADELGILKSWIDAGGKDDSTGEVAAAKSKPIEIGPLPPGIHPINALDLTADGRRVAAGLANVVEVYDVDSGVELIRLGGHKDLIQSVRFRPDGKQLAAGSYQFVSLWDAPQLTLEKTFTGSPEIIKTSLELRDNKTILTAGVEKAIRFWNKTDGKLTRSLTTVTGIDFLTISYDEKTLATISPDGTARLVNLTDGKEIVALKSPKGVLLGASFAADGKTLNTLGVDGSIMVWNLPAKATDKPIKTFAIEKKKAAKAFLVIDGSIFVGGDDALIHQVNLADGKVIRTFEGATGPVLSVAIARDGKTLASGSADKKIRLYERETGKLVGELGPLSAAVTHLSFASHGKRLLTASSDGNLTEWDLGTRKVAMAFSQPSSKPGTSIAMNKAFYLDDGQIVSVAEKQAYLWKSTGAWAEVRKLGPHVFRVLAIEFSPDGKLIATGGGEPSRSGEVKIWETTTGKLVRSLDALHSDTVFGLKFSPDGTKLASVAADKFLKVTNVSDGKELKSFEGHTHHVLGVDWKSDGKQLVTSGADNVIKLWDYETGEQVRTLNPATKQVTALKWLAGKPQVVAGTGEPAVKIWNPDNGGITRTFDGPADYIFAVTASTDGSRVAAGGADGVLLIWNGLTGQSIRKIAPSTIAVGAK
jgi:WD40 repeat protein